MPVAVNLAEKFAAMPEAWVPTIVGELNGQYVKVVRFEGEYVWHHHDHEDEMFLVMEGTMRLCFRDGDVMVGPGEFCVVPRGVEHKPVAEPVCQVVLFEPATTRNTGNVDHDLTLEPDELPRG
jgi:mannose-6-phosphate isomerase-like protein (cupin superfamily)